MLYEVITAPQWAQFAKDFEKARFDENGNENWDSIIIDARGMPGGNSAPMEFLARSLYGNEVRSCDKETVITSYSIHYTKLYDVQ